MVSVVIPTFNRSDTLGSAIESVFAQTYSDYELIVIDDGSTDGTREKIAPYAGRIRYFYQPNRGASAARNRGIAVASGQWVSFLDSDDIWLPTKLERQVEALSAMGSEFGVCFTDCKCVGSRPSCRSVFEQAGLKAGGPFAELPNPIEHVLARRTPFWVPALLVRRSLLLHVGGFDEAMATQEDTDLLFRLALETRFCFVAAPLVEIDTTPSRPRLSTQDLGRNDQVHGRLEYRYKKWLALPELSDARTRNAIHDRLRLLYYNWMIAKLYKLHLADAMIKGKSLRQMNESYLTICGTLLCRAVMKIPRSLSKAARGTAN